MRGDVRVVSAVLSFLIGWAAASCRPATLVRASGDLEFTPAELELPAQYVGGEAELTVTLLNKGRAPLSVQVSGLASPFTLSLPANNPLPKEVQSGASQWVVHFKPSALGRFEQTITVKASDESFASLRVVGVAQELPSCPTAASCHQMRFDVGLGECVETALADGTMCDPASACIEGTATCSGGVCVGRTKSCDDGNACTTDVCNALEGCQHLPAPPCPGDGKCQEGVCDPTLGCGLKPAEDGTRCGSTFSCDVADVCIEGQCVERDPPDGFICQPATPCGAVGRCEGSTCEVSQPSALQETWSYGLSSGSTYEPWSDLLLEPSGAVSLFGFFATPMLHANDGAGVVGAASARRCMLWNSRLVCADFAANGRVSAVDLQTGRSLWDFNVLTARPDFAALTRSNNLFMARLGEMGSDRLAALFEGYPVGSTSSTQCRLYVLVVLNASGQIVSAQRVEDPLLDVCNHPHPYGFASDVDGNLFVAFSGTRNDVAPLQPDSPTLLLAYTRDGIFRWKRTENFPGGELAVAKGTLYPENGSQPYSATDGQARGSVGTMGRVVITNDLFVASPGANPLDGQGAVSSYNTSTLSKAWTFYPPGGSFGSDQIRLAKWRPYEQGPTQDVALYFGQSATGLSLGGISMQDGSVAFECPLPDSVMSTPQMFEVANGSIAVMEGASTCGRCDPPFANSRGIFRTFSLPGIEVSDAPWSGTFGGAGHDHHEDGVPSVTVN